MVASHELQLRWVKALQPRPVVSVSMSDMPPASSVLSPTLSPQQPTSPTDNFEALSDDRSTTPVSFTSSTSASRTVFFPKSGKSPAECRRNNNNNNATSGSLASRLAHSTGGSLSRSFDSTKRQSGDTIGLTSAFNSPLEVSRCSPLRCCGLPGQFKMSRRIKPIRLLACVIQCSFLHYHLFSTCDVKKSPRVGDQYPCPNQATLSPANPSKRMRMATSIHLCRYRGMKAALWICTHARFT